MTLHGPASGYANKAKDAWREWVWGWVGGWQDGAHHTGDVLLMPSSEGYEIVHLLERGFTPGQLHVVDRSPAVVATLQRQCPGIHTYGCSVERACRRVAASGIKPIGSNLDFCGKLSRPLTKVVADCWRSGALDHGWVFINVLRGREDPWDEQMVPLNPAVKKHFLEGDLALDKWWESDDGIEPTEKDLWRIQLLWRCAEIKERAWWRAKAYCSPNGQSFLTVAYPPPDPKEAGWLKEAIVSHIPGAPLPDSYSGETYSQWRRRLTLDQRVRLAAMAYQMGVGESSVFRYCDVNVRPERTAV